MNNKKVLLIGWDAADWKIIQPFMDRGLMPHVKKLVENGVMANISTLIPALSPILWTSISTGKRAYKHGILGFSEPMPNGEGIQPITNLSRKTKAIWNILGQNGAKSNVVGWWPSNPAEPINGVMVSDHYYDSKGALEEGWPMMRGTVYPPRLTQTLADLRVHPNELSREHLDPFIPLGHTIDQDKDQRLAHCTRLIADCTTIQSAATYLMENEPWDFMAAYFITIDHFSHTFMRYHPPQLEWVNDEDYELYKGCVSAAYVYHDMMLGRLVELAGEDTTIILMSDHGFHPDHMRRKEVPNEPAGPQAEHRDHGIFVINGPGIRKDELVHGVSLLDVTPTILTLFGLEVGEDMDGQPILEVFEEPPEVKTIPSWDDVSGEDGRHPKDMKLTPEESREAIDHLVALGYIDPVSEDNERAIRDTQIELDYHLARSYMDNGLYGEAIPVLTKLYQDCPVEFRFGIQLAACLQAQNHIEDLDELVNDLKNRWFKASTQAKSRMQEINQIFKERREAAEEASEKKGIALSNDEKTFDKLFNAEEKYVCKKIRDVARGSYHTLDYMAGWVAMSKNDNEAAIEHFKAAGETDTKAPAFHFQLGEAYRKLQKYTESRECFDRVLELDPHSANAHLGLARVYLSLSKNKRARISARKAIGLKYQLPPAHYCMGICHDRAKEFRAAINSFETAIRLNPNFSEAHTEMARIYAENLNDQDQAEYHRSMAEAIDEERKKYSDARILPDLANSESIDYEAELPLWPAQEEETMQPALLEAPERKPDESADPSEAIVVVSGLPRSGTSMVMQMLSAVGIKPLTDGERAADENNPKGYFELEKVKQLKSSNNWLEEAKGKSIKVVSPLLPYLPQGLPYRVIVIERDIDEIVASQHHMLKKMGEESADLSDEKLKVYLAGQLNGSKNRLHIHDVPWLGISHSETIEHPEQIAEKIAEFLGGGLDAKAMSQVVDASLHRQRGQSTTT